MLSITECLLWIALCGAGGGLAACIHKDAVVLPRYDKRARIWRPGGIGTVVVGAIAADLVWAFYGAAAGHDFVNMPSQSYSLTMSQLAASFLTGWSGGKVLELMADKQTQQFSRDQLAKILKESVEKQDKEQ